MTQMTLQTAASRATQDDPMSAPVEEPKNNEDVENKADDAISEETDLAEDDLFTRCIQNVKVKMINAARAKKGNRST